MKKLRKNVLANLVEQNKDKESNEAYWSYQLLIKLGVVPDPTAVTLDGEQLRVSQMSPE